MLSTFPRASTNINDFQTCSARKNDRVFDNRELELQMKKKNQRGKRTKEIREVVSFIKLIYAPWKKNPLLEPPRKLKSLLKSDYILCLAVFLSTAGSGSEKGNFQCH